MAEICLMDATGRAKARFGIAGKGISERLFSRWVISEYERDEDLDVLSLLSRFEWAVWSRYLGQISDDECYSRTQVILHLISVRHGSDITLEEARRIYER